MKLSEMIALAEARGDWGEFDVDVRTGGESITITIRNLRDITVPTTTAKTVRQIEGIMKAISKESGIRLDDNSIISKFDEQLMFYRIGRYKSENEGTELDTKVYELVATMNEIIKSLAIEESMKETKLMEAILEDMSTATTVEDVERVAQKWSSSL